VQRIQSYWEEKYYFRDLDVVIIGAGIVGLSTGISLLEKNPGLKILILERSSIPYGASTRNAGFACFGSPTELLSELDQSSSDEVFELFARRYAGIQSLLSRTGNRKIGYEKLGGHEVLTADQEISTSQIDRLNHYINGATGISHYFKQRNELLTSFDLKGFTQCIYTLHEACLDPMLMLQALQQIYQQQGGRILYGVNLEDWEDQGSSVSLKIFGDYHFNTSDLVIATNGFAQEILPDIDVRAARNLVLLLRPQKGTPVRGCFHYHKGYVYFRHCDDKLLIGGGRHTDIENEYTSEMNINFQIQQYLLDFVTKHILHDQTFELVSQWPGILGLGSARKPIIQKISGHVVVAVRLSGIGIAIGTLVGSEAAELVLNNPQKTHG